MTTKTRAGKPSPSRLPASGKIAAAQSTGIPSKYLAESEKNLNLVLPAAPSADTTLIVDDADELFARRSSDKP